MVVQCTAFGCDTKSSIETRKENITFYKFPLHDPVRLETWTRAVNYGVPPEKEIQPNQYNSLCSLHFVDNFIEKSGSVPRLKPNAIPTKFNGKTIQLKKPNTSTKSGGRTPQTNRRINSTSVKLKKENRLAGSARSTPTSKVTFKSSPLKATPKGFTSILKPKSVLKPTPKPKTINKIRMPLVTEALKPVMHPAISKILVVKLQEFNQFCCVPQCEAEQAKQKGLIYVSLPTDHERFEEWLTLMGRPDLLKAEGTSVAKTAVICTTHFAEEMWVKSKTRTRLVKHAVPSIFPLSIKQENDSSSSEESEDEWYSSPKFKAQVKNFDKNYDIKLENSDFEQKPKKPGPASKTLPNDIGKYKDSESATSGLREMKQLSLTEKLKILKRAEAKDGTLTELSEDFQVTRNCVIGIKKSKIFLLKKAEELLDSSKSPATKKSKPVSSKLSGQFLEDTLNTWMVNEKRLGKSLTNSSILAKAKSIYINMIQKYNDKITWAQFCDNGDWFKSFMQKVNMGTPSKSFSNGVKRKLSTTPKSDTSFDEGHDDDDEDFDPDTYDSPTKHQPPAKKKCVTKAKVRNSFGNNLTCPVCSRELSKWDRLKNHLINIHDYYVNENNELVPPPGMVDNNDSSDSETLPPENFLEVNFFEGTDSKSGGINKDRGLEAVLKLKCNEIDDLKKEIDQLKKHDIIDKDGKPIIEENSDAPKKPAVELKYTEEHKKLWENLVLAEIKKSKKYMEGLEKAQKVLNNQMKENVSLKQKLKAAENSPANSNSSYALKKKLNDEIQKNKKLQEKVKKLIEENKNHQKSGSGGGDSSIKNEKIGSIYVKLKKAEESLKTVHAQSLEQAKKFKWRYAQQTKQFQKSIRQNTIKCGRLQKKCKMMNVRLNGIREVGSISQIIRDAGKYLTNEQVTFCEGQMKANTQSNEKFWSPAFQELVHSLYQTSPKAYQIYQKYFALPAVYTVKRWITENELVTRGINEATIGAFTEEFKSIQELEERYDTFSQDPTLDLLQNEQQLPEETNNNVKLGSEMQQVETTSIIGHSDQVLQEQPEEEQFDLNGLEHIPERDEEEMEAIEDEEEEEGRETHQENDETLFDSDDDEDGVIKSDDEDLGDIGDSDWSDDSNGGTGQKVNSMLSK